LRAPKLSNTEDCSPRAQRVRENETTSWGDKANGRKQRPNSEGTPRSPGIAKTGHAESRGGRKMVGGERLELDRQNQQAYDFIRFRMTIFGSMSTREVTI
jgi:hypothetical protein